MPRMLYTLYNNTAVRTLGLYKRKKFYVMPNGKVGLGEEKAFPDYTGLRLV